MSLIAASLPLGHFVVSYRSGMYFASEFRKSRNGVPCVDQVKEGHIVSAGLFERYLDCYGFGPFC